MAYVGYKGLIAYGAEASFGAGTIADINSDFGYGQKISRLEIGREFEDIYKIGDRRVETVVGKAKRHRVSVEAILGRPDILGFVMKHNVDTTTGNEWYSFLERPGSYVVGVYFGKSGSSGYDEAFVISGAVPTSLEIRADATSPIWYTVEFVGAKFARATAPAAPTIGTSNGMYATLSPNTSITLTDANGNTYSGTVRSVNIRINHNVDFIFGVGGSEAKDYYVKAYEVELEFTAYFNNGVWVSNMLDEVGLSTVTVLFEDIINSANKKLQFELEAGAFAKITRSDVRYEPNEVAEITMTVKASDIKVSLI